MDDQQRARELLAEGYEVIGWPQIARDILSGSVTIDRQVMHAITAALRAAPEGFVMVPVEPTEAMVDRATWEEVGGHCRSCTALPASHSDARRVWTAMLAARPQGVKG
jgi:hypothetical protein